MQICFSHTVPPRAQENRLIVVADLSVLAAALLFPDISVNWDVNIQYG